MMQVKYINNLQVELKCAAREQGAIRLSMNQSRAEWGGRIDGSCTETPWTASVPPQ